MTVDLNSDLGESFGRWVLGDDEAMLGLVTSANVACGFHAGDPSTLRRTCTIAAQNGVAVGAQVGYRDLAGFGRRFIDVEPVALADDVVYQIGALDGMCRVAGTRVRYVKPHGALYNAIVHHEAQAEAVVAAVRDYDPVAARARAARLGVPGRGREGRPADGAGVLRRPRLHAGGHARAPLPAGCAAARPGGGDRAGAADGRPTGSSPPWTAATCGWRPSRPACTATHPVPSRWPRPSARASTAAGVELRRSPRSVPGEHERPAVRGRGAARSRSTACPRCWRSPTPCAAHRLPACSTSSRRRGRCCSRSNRAPTSSRCAGRCSTCPSSRARRLPTATRWRSRWSTTDPTSTRSGGSPDSAADGVVAAHTGTPWRVAFGGFAPGFAYLAGGDPRLDVARRAEPRTSVPAGSVGLAGEFSGVYPRSSPGGLAADRAHRCGALGPRARGACSSPAVASGSGRCGEPGPHARTRRRAAWRASWRC